MRAQANPLPMLTALPAEGQPYTKEMRTVLLHRLSSGVWHKKKDLMKLERLGGDTGDINSLKAVIASTEKTWEDAKVKPLTDAKGKPLKDKGSKGKGTVAAAPARATKDKGTAAATPAPARQARQRSEAAFQECADEMSPNPRGKKVRKIRKLSAYPYFSIALCHNHVVSFCTLTLPQNP